MLRPAALQRSVGPVDLASRQQGVPRPRRGMLPPARLPTIVKTNLFRPRCADMGRPFLKEVSSCPVLASLLCPATRAVRRDALRGRTAACAAQPRDAAQAGETAVAGRMVRQCRSDCAD